MPIFYAGVRNSALQDPRLVSAETSEVEREGTLVIEERRSLSPESGGITLTTKDGCPISRGEVIERLKRGESPTWTVKHNRSSPKPCSPSPPRDIPQKPSISTLLPSPEFVKHGSAEDLVKENQVAGLEIERPRSALHSGDFRPQKEGTCSDAPVGSPLSTSPPVPWRSNFSTPFSGPRSFDCRPAPILGSNPLSNSFFLPPTSPLINALSNPDLEYSFDKRKSSSPESRRYSFSVHSFQSPRSISGSITPARSSGAYHPYQAHQPRRSVSIPHTPSLRPRGISISSEQSPLHHAPMVGSYEESILRGRMSTTPSKPLNFIAQIGVLGRGKCKPSLRCPPHASITFPAVFYSYNSNGRIVDNQPSPYVGLIDIEQSFPTADLRSPPGGNYRIPQQGQLQIIIKNPNKTAVKLFLVPYDLSDMEPGQKTFIRQRCYSTGPIVDVPLMSSKIDEYGQDSKSPDTQVKDSVEKPTLRYLIHLNICCTGKGRYYLYKSIRVVFANRVPDGKEKLRNEIQFPEPKYSIYKPSVLPIVSTSQSSLGTALSEASKSARRRSTPFSFGLNNLDQLDGITSSPRSTLDINLFKYRTNDPPLPHIPIGLQQLDDSQESSNQHCMEIDSAQPQRGPFVMDPNDGVELTNFDPGMDWMDIDDEPKH